MSELQDRQATQALLRGMNTMQMQAGLMPGGIPLQPVPQMQMPQMQPMHPSQFSTGLQVQFQQQQQIAQLTLPPMQFGGLTPVARPNGFFHQNMPPVQFPGAQFGAGQGMARQHAVLGTNQHLAGMQSGVGLGFRSMGTLGAAGVGAMLGSPFGPGGMLVGGIAGATAFEHFGGGQMMHNMGNSLMTPMIQARQRQLEMQQMSMGFVRSGPQLGPGGQGLSATASMRLGQGLMNMSDSTGFQQDTGGMFNRQDVMKITRLAGQFGMLDQSRTADDIKNSVGKISRALSNFMKLAEEPDVQEAMRMMANMRSLGMNVGESNVAVRNARQFARMAGTNVQGVMAAGMQGASMFQQAGLSGGAGLNAGMAATGMAGQMAGLMSPARLAMAGGREGVASSIMQGAAQAGTLDAMLPAMLTRRNGQLAIDQDAVLNLAQGRMTIQDVMRTGSSRIQQLGGREALMELSTRRRELQDEAQRGMGGQMAALLPMIQARAIVAGTPGMTMGGAFRTMGMGEQQARTFEQMGQDPRFWANMRQQQQQTVIEGRREIAARQERLEAEGRIPPGIRRGLAPVRDAARRGANAFDEFMEHELGMGQDIDEATRLSGGPLIRASRSRLGSDVSMAHARDAVRRDSSGFAARSAHSMALVRQGIDQEDAMGSRLAGLRAGNPLAGAVASQFIGPHGFGFTQGARGGQFIRETVMDQESGLTQGMHLLGMGPARSTGQIRQRADEMERMGRMMESTGNMSVRQRDEIRTRGRQATGSMPEERFREARSQAAAAINSYLESTTGTFLNSDISETEMQQRVATRLRSNGFSEAEINNVIKSQDFMRSASTHGERSRTAGARAAAERHASAGGTIGVARDAQTADQFRQLADRQRESGLEVLGGRAGATASRADATQINELMGGDGDDVAVQARRTLFAIRALEAQETAGGGTETTRRQRESLVATFEGFSRSARETAEIDVNTRTEGMDQDTLAGIGSHLSGLRDVQGALRRGGDAIQRGNESDLNAAGSELLGARGAEIFNGQGIEGLRRYLQSGGTLDGLTEEQQRQIREGDESMTDESIQAMISSRGGSGPSITSGAGIRRLTESLGNRDFGAVMDQLQGAFTHGGESPTAGPRTPQTFEQAVGTFSQASEQLLQAAEAMNSGGALSSVSGVMASAAFGMTPLPGILGVIPGLSGRMFGGG